MPRSLLLPSSLAAVALVALASGCAVPHGSLARPVQPAGAGSNLVGGGVMVPFAAVGGGSFDDDSFFGGGTAEEVFVIPGASYDYALGDRHYIGFDVSFLHPGLSTAGGDSDGFGVFVNPRWEYGLNETFSLTVDGNLGYIASGDGGAPFIAPTFGMRAYIPTGFGGAIISQQLGTAFITLALPGSLAYDLPIELGEDTVLHIFPEVRWDPTLVFVPVGAVDDDASSSVIGFAFFSGGLSVMLEI